MWKHHIYIHTHLKLNIQARKHSSPPGKLISNWALTWYGMKCRKTPSWNIPKRGLSYNSWKKVPQRYSGRKETEFEGICRWGELSVLISSNESILSLLLKVSNTCLMVCRSKIVIEYDQEIPQSQTADKPMAPRGRATQQSLDTRRTN